MRYPVYAYRDVKVGFGQPKLALNDAVMKRSFGRDVNVPGSELEYAPSDYELYRIGEYETDNGQMFPITPEYICNGQDVIGGV